MGALQHELQLEVTAQHSLHSVMLHNVEVPLIDIYCIDVMTILFLNDLFEGRKGVAMTTNMQMCSPYFKDMQLCLYCPVCNIISIPDFLFFDILQDPMGKWP